MSSGEVVSFNLELLLSGDYHDWLVSGFFVSLKLALFSLVFALPLGFGIALLRVAPFTVVRAFGAVYVETVRNVPLLAQLLFWYFGAPNLLPQSMRERLYAGNIEFICAVIALSLYSAAYMAEDIRSGIRSVPAVQVEAARALGLGFAATMRRVILPQALKATLSPLLSQALNLWKNSSVATVIGVAELMYQAARVETASFKSTEAFLFVTVAYSVVSILLTMLAAYFGPRRRIPVL